MTVTSKHGLRHTWLPCQGNFWGKQTSLLQAVGSMVYRHTWLPCQGNFWGKQTSLLQAVGGMVYRHTWLPCQGNFLGKQKSLQYQSTRRLVQCGGKLAMVV